MHIWMNRKAGKHMELAMRLTTGVRQAAARKASAREEEQNRIRLLEELREVRRLLACNEAWFQLETDLAMVEACVFERRSLLARSRALLEEAKRRRLTAAG